MWYCVDCWRGVKHQVTYLLTVLTGGAEDSALSSKPPPPPPPPPTPPFSSQAFHLTAMWCCVDWCCWSEGGRLQLNTHAPCLCGFEWSDTVDRLWGAWWYGVRRSCAETAAVSCGTSYARTNSKVCTPFQWLVKRRTVKGYSHWFRIQCSGAVWKSRLPSRAPVPGSRPGLPSQAPVPNKPMVFVDVKQHYMFISIIIQNHMWHEHSESAGELRIALLYYPHYRVSRDSSVVRVSDSWLKGRKFESQQEWRENFFSRVNFLCWLLFQYPFHLRVTAVACKRSRSFCQKCRWQVTAKHAYSLRMWLCMKWHGAWLYGAHRTCAKMAAVPCGTSHAGAVSTPHQWIFKKIITR